MGKKLAVALLLVLSSAPVFAAVSPVVGDVLRFTDYMSGQNGGSLLANPVAPSYFTAFRTFCVEVEEYIYVGGATQQYKIAGIGTQTNAGGKTLTPETAWLYTQYVNGALPGYSDSVLMDRQALQYGIWSSMGYTDAQLLSRFGSGYQTVINSFTARPWDSMYAVSGWTGTGNVQIMNLVWANSHNGGNPGDRAQDQLMMSAVPAPGAALLGALGCSVMAWYKRRNA